MTATAEAPKVKASTTKAHPVPNNSMMMPPIKGPISVYVTGRTNCASEFACTSRSSGTSVGTIEVSDGLKIA